MLYTALECANKKVRFGLGVTLYSVCTALNAASYRGCTPFGYFVSANASQNLTKGLAGVPRTPSHRLLRM